MSQKKKARVFTREFKLHAVQAMLAGESPVAIAPKFKLLRELLCEWKDAYPSRRA